LGKQDSFAEEVESGAAIHLAFDHLIRLTLPSTAPELCGVVSPAMTACQSRFRPPPGTDCACRSAAAHTPGKHLDLPGHRWHVDVPRSRKTRVWRARPETWMRPRLSYLASVPLIGGTDSSEVKALDAALGGALLLATAGTSELAKITEFVCADVRSPLR
jgi:hypothetical protein